MLKPIFILDLFDFCNLAQSVCKKNYRLDCKFRTNNFYLESNVNEMYLRLLAVLQL